MKKYIGKYLLVVITGISGINFSLQAGNPKDFSLEKLFTEIYLRNAWSCKESVSGPGSTLYNTRSIRLALPKIIEKLSIKSMLDASCGDFNWMKEVNLGCDYIGVDIVKPMIENLQKEFTDATHSFLYGDITNMDIPHTDLILCRDCLMHLGYENIFKALRNFKKSGARYLLTTTFPNTHKNRDLQEIGFALHTWQPINLQDAPLNFPKPLLLIYEHQSGIDIDKHIALWRLEDINL